MTDGIDFSDYDQEAIDNMKQVFSELEMWQFIDEGNIINELNGVSERINGFISQVIAMQVNNDYKKTDDLRKTILMNDLGPGGWISTFYMKNDDLNGDIPSDDFFNTLSGVLGDGKGTKQAFLTCKKYYKDIGELLKVMIELRGLLPWLPFENANALDMIVDNFKECGFDKQLYEDIDAIMYNADAWVSQWIGSDRHSKAPKAEKYYQENVGKLSKSSLRDGYRKKRRETYLDSAESQWFVRRGFRFTSDGVFSVSPEMDAKTEIIDDYTIEIAQMKSNSDYKGQCELAIKECKRIQNEVLTEARKKTSALTAVQNLLGTCESLVRHLHNYFENHLETYKLFTEANNNAPYCYMKYPRAIADKNYIAGELIRDGDPQDKGTRLRNAFTNVAKGLTKICNQFVNEGHPELR